MKRIIKKAAAVFTAAPSLFATATEAETATAK